MRSTWRWRCCGWFRIGGSRRVLRARDLRDGAPRAGRHLVTEPLLEQHPEDRPLGGRHIGTEHFPFCHEENTCAIPLDGQPELRRRSIAQKRDNALRGRFQAERPIRVGCKHLAEHVHGTHDREKCLTEPLQHCAFGFALQRRCRCGARVERDVSARQNGLDVCEPRRFERLLQLGHLRVHRADPTEKRRIAWHEMKASESTPLHFAPRRRRPLASPSPASPPASSATRSSGGRCTSPTRSSSSHKGRSEEHTSELQSPCNLVCRLLLEKKKIT